MKLRRPTKHPASSRPHSSRTPTTYKPKETTKASSDSKYQSTTALPPPPVPTQYSTTTTTTSEPGSSDSYGAPFTEPEGLPNYQESPAATSEASYQPPSTTVQPSVTTKDYLQPTYEKYKLPLTLPTFYSPPEPTTRRTPVPYSSPGTTFVAPFTESDLTYQSPKQDQPKYQAPASSFNSHGSPPKEPSKYNQIETTTSSIDTYGAPQANHESQYQAPLPSQYTTAVTPANNEDVKSIDTYGSPQAKPEETLPQYSSPSQPQYTPAKPSADIDTYGSPKANTESTQPPTQYSQSQYSQPTPNESIDTYGSPKANPTAQYSPPLQSQYSPPTPNESIDTYGSPKANPQSTQPPSQYSPPPQSQYSPPPSNESIDTYGSPQSNPETTPPPSSNQYSPPTPESAADNYGAPGDKPSANPNYQAPPKSEAQYAPPPLPQYNQPTQQIQYSPPPEETSSPATENKDSYGAPQSQTKPSGVKSYIILIFFWLI